MIRWSTAPNPLPPLVDNIHVWAVALTNADFDISLWLRHLSPDERERAERFKFAYDRRCYIVAHVALRDIVGNYLKITGKYLEFTAGENGKPKLADALVERGLEFNLSHSHEIALIAVTRGRRVGVDIEYVNNNFDFHEVAKHFFTGREVAALTTLPSRLQRQAFYKCWTSKEAFLKAKGVGLSGALDEVEIASEGGNQIEIKAAVIGWSLIELDPGDGYESALVVEGDSVPIFRYLWQGV
ncbi:MAG: 4'-phosphopantetheinyl transferase family protein [Chloroflexota bacterium]